MKVFFAELKQSLVEWRKLDRWIVVAAISLWRRRLSARVTVDILNTFCAVFMVRRIKLMLRIFELWVLLFDCCVYRQNVV